VVLPLPVRLELLEHQALLPLLALLLRDRPLRLPVVLPLPVRLELLEQQALLPLVPPLREPQALLPLEPPLLEPQPQRPKPSRQLSLHIPMTFADWCLQ